MLDDVRRLTGVVEKLEDLFGDGHGRRGGVEVVVVPIRGRRW
jgi:hypothetical protein